MLFLCPKGRWFIIITLKDINIAIVKQVTAGLVDTKYSTTVFSSTDIVEEIIRPCFYFDILHNKTNLMLQHAEERSLELQLFYFTTTRTGAKIEVFEMEDLLSEIFKDNLKITDDYFVSIHGCDFDTNKTDGYLILNIELDTFEELEDEGIEMLEELVTELKINL